MRKNGGAAIWECDRTGGGVLFGSRFEIVKKLMFARRTNSEWPNSFSNSNV